MARARQILRILPTLMLTGLSVAFILEWRSARQVNLRVESDLRGTIDALRKSLEVQGTRWSSILERVRKGHEMLQAVAERIDQMNLGPSSAPVVVEAEPADESISSIAENANVDEAPLTLPEGLSVERFIEDWNLDDFLKNPRWNPNGKELTRVQKSKAVEAATFARCILEILNSRIRAEVAEGMEKMFQVGNFVEYGPNERPIAIPGVFTAGEEVEGQGMRLYYFHPEEFPGIYEKRKEKRKIAETAARRLLSMFE